MNARTKKRLKRLAIAVAALGVVVGVGVLNASQSNGAVKPDCKNLMYPLCPRSVAATQVVDNSLPASKIVKADRDKFLKDDNTPDIAGTASVHNIDPVVVAHIGGSFKTNKTEAGTFQLPAHWSGKLEMSYFCGRTVTGAPGTRMMMALRVGATDTAFGDDYGTVIGQEISPTKDREITASNFKYVTNNSDSAVTVGTYFFGYNDDTSAAGSGEVTCSGQVAAVNS